MSCNKNTTGLYDPEIEHSACGVGFITRKDGTQTHDLLKLGHQALCAVPHRGGMSSEGVGDGAGISVDLSAYFFSKVTKKRLSPGQFGVGNFFLPIDTNYHAAAADLIEEEIKMAGFKTIKVRDLPVDKSQICEKAIDKQLLIRQWVFVPKSKIDIQNFEMTIHPI